MKGWARGLESGNGRGPRRGTARVARIDAVHPLTGETSPVLRPNSRTVQVPSLPITHTDVLAAAERLPTAGDIVIHFITPMRLVEREQLVKVPYFRPLLHRLIERIKSLAENFGGGAVPYEIRDLRDLADGVGLVEDHASWLDLRGYSTRLEREQVIGGLVGRATYRAADWTPFRPWLVWGTILHAGKNAVKGDGWFGIEAGGTRNWVAGGPNPLTPFPAREGGTSPKLGCSALLQGKGGHLQSSAAPPSCKGRGDISKAWPLRPLAREGGHRQRLAAPSSS